MGRRSLVVVALALLLAGGAVAGPLGAAPVATTLHLRGHLPDLGEDASIRVFLTAEAWDAYRDSLGELAEIFPTSERLFFSFDREVLVLYHAGRDPVGGRSLRTEAAGSFDAGTGEMLLHLYWEEGTSGAPAGARYPFLLVSVARTGEDELDWVGPTARVCASAPELEGRRACENIADADRPPDPRPTPTATPTPAASPTPPATPTPTPVPTAPDEPPGGAPPFTIVLGLAVIGSGVLLLALLAVLSLFRRGREV